MQETDLCSPQPMNLPVALMDRCGLLSSRSPLSLSADEPISFRARSLLSRSFVVLPRRKQPSPRLSIHMLTRVPICSGQAVIAVVHQPSASLFSQFDDLLLMKGGGHVSRRPVLAA